MKAYIKKCEENSLFYQAKCGLIKLGYEIIMYDNLSEKIEEDAIVVGYISDIHNIAKIMGFSSIKQLNYPSQLKKYLQRNIIKVSLKDLPQNYPFFVKPTSVKTFSGRVINTFRDLIGIQDVELYYTNTILDIVSEYRCFVLNNKIIGVKHYKGNPYKALNESTILSMLKDFTDSPNAYSLDIGITRDNKNVLIECNNAYSSGNYGLSDLMYAQFLIQGYLDIAKY